MSKVFIKAIDNEGYQVITLLDGHIYVDICDFDEILDIYNDLY